MRHLILFLALAACGGPADVSTSTPPAKTEGHEAKEEHEEKVVGPDGPEDLKVPAIGAIATDAESVAKGLTVFEQKGCGACHKFGSKLVGPDLAGVTERRTPIWLAKMIQHPEQMTKEDPVAKGLYRTLMVQMTAQGVSDEDLPYLLAYINSSPKSP